MTESSAPRKLMWEDAHWAGLLGNISRGQVIPIVGPALSVITIDGVETTVDCYLATELAKRLALDGIPPQPTLNDVVSSYLRQNTADDIDVLYWTTGEILQARKNELVPSQALLQLAEVTDFKLFVTTACDPLLEMALNQVRFGGQETTEVLSYVPNAVNDIQPNQQRTARATVFHLLGRISLFPGEFVISDEDLLEYICALQATPPERLFDELRNHHLLILGGNLPDWLARLFLRSAKGARLSHSRRVYEIVADSKTLSDTSLVTFLSDFSRRTKVFSEDAPKFVELLHRQWKERGNNGGPRPVPMMPAATRVAAEPLFISYANEDLAAAEQLKTDLEAAGFKIWFDRDRLGGGAAYDQKILDQINRCELFIALLSQNSDARREGYFRKEWDHALDRQRRFDQSDAFIVPVVIDDTDSNTANFRRVPQRFRELTGQALPGGRATQQFVTTLRSYIHERE